MKRRDFLHLAAGSATLALPRVAMADTYPSRPVRVIVGLPPANSPDIIARLISGWLSERLGQPFVVENRPGAATGIATELVVRAAPDGYTLLLVVAGNTVNGSVFKNLNYDFGRDIAPVASIGGIPLAMAVTPSFPAKTVAGIHRLCQSQSGQGLHGLVGQRQRAARRRRVVRDDGRRRSHACPVSQQPVSRSAQRTGAGHVQPGAGGDRLRSSGQAAGAGGDDGAAPRCLVRRAHGGRIRPRL